MVRRLKNVVDTSIKQKKETIIECSLTKYKKQFYRAILESNAGFLTHNHNLLNIPMELRKAYIHPFLIKGAEDKILQVFPQPVTPQSSFTAMIRASGKIILIDKLFPHLKDSGHCVLIFSQMTQLLDILHVI
jgi:chromodomain-helicase-DNA-binding protein 7